MDVGLVDDEVDCAEVPAEIEVVVDDALFGVQESAELEDATL